MVQRNLVSGPRIRFLLGISMSGCPYFCALTKEGNRSFRSNGQLIFIKYKGSILRHILFSFSAYGRRPFTNFPVHAVCRNNIGTDNAAEMKLFLWLHGNNKTDLQKKWLRIPALVFFVAISSWSSFFVFLLVKHSGNSPLYAGKSR